MSGTEWKLRVPSSLVAHTFGSLVAYLQQAGADVDDQLFKIGRSIGSRLIDDFLSKSGLYTGAPRCNREVAKMADLTKLAFSNYLGVLARVLEQSEDSFTISLSSNPLEQFLPEERLYGRIICGIVFGAFDALQIAVKCTQLDKTTFAVHLPPSRQP